MPKYTPTAEDMDESYASAPVSAPDSSSSQADTVDEENAGAAEILVSKDKLPEGTKEGDVCSFKVTKDFGDEVSLEYVDESEPEETEPTTASPEDQAASEISALDTGAE